MRDQLQRRGLVGWQMVFGDGQVQADAEDDADAFRCGRQPSGDRRPAIVSGIGALLGAAIGTKIALLINEDILKIMMLVALPCAAILLMLKKDFGKENDAPAREFTPQQELTRAALIGLGLGCYDGLIGPGTGTFMIMAFTMALSMDLLTASGCAKIANLCSNVASAVLFIFSGKVWWLLALPAAACNMLGAYCGTRYAMKGGSKRVRGMIFVVLGLLFIKMGYELLF